MYVCVYVKKCIVLFGNLFSSSSRYSPYHTALSMNVFLVFLPRRDFWKQSFRQLAVRIFFCTIFFFTYLVRVLGDQANILRRRQLHCEFCCFPPTFVAAFWFTLNFPIYFLHLLRQLGLRLNPGPSL